MADSRSPVDEIAAALARLRGRGMHPRGHSMHPHGHPAHLHDEGRGDETADGHRPGRGWGGPGWGGPGWAGPGGGRFGGPARMRLLEALSTADHPLTVGEIAEAVGVDQPRASRLVQQSVELGFVRREADPDDARRTRVALTDVGATFVRGFRGERRETIATALSGFTDTERADLARLLTKLADAWPKV